jgi:hypothetical protein
MAIGSSQTQSGIPPFESTEVAESALLPEAGDGSVLGDAVGACARTGSGSSNTAHGLGVAVRDKSNVRIATEVCFLCNI